MSKEIEDISGESEAQCPYCLDVHNDSWETVGCGDGDSTVIDCECGKRFHVVCQVTVDYDSSPDCELNGEEHIPVYNERLDADFCEVCTKCLKIKVKEREAKNA